MADNNIKDKIMERIYIKGELELVSPLILGGGEDEYTDIDLLKDRDGKPFIPGTSIAGVIRHYLDERLRGDYKNLVPILFGKKEKESTQSLISFYDALPAKEPDIQIRDGVELVHETKTAKDNAKYDYEVLEPRQSFQFRCEIVIREKYASEKDGIKTLVYLIIDAMKKEKIALGAKTARGFGLICLHDEKILCLNMTKKEHIRRWIDFSWQDFNGNNGLSDFSKNIPEIPETEFAEITADFEIQYSILIRTYSSSPDNPDATHLTSNGKSVVPGTSWNGAIRHAVYHILKQLNKPDKYKELTDKLFGYVDKEKNKARASKILIRESVIEGGRPFPYSRNKIDRFTGGVVDSALFDEMPHYGGKVRLYIVIKQPEMWEIGLVLLALKDIGNGIQPIGGDANIGRGMLRSVGLHIKPELNEGECLQSLAGKLQE